jgi:hypothetical protein
MKRFLAVAFSILILCGLLLLNMGMVQASEEGYEVSEAYDTAVVTLDGNWANNEWEDGWIEYMDASTADERFVYKASSNLEYAPEFLIESADTTNDTGDIWQIVCIGVPVETGGVPQSGQNKIEIVGHKTLTVYEGNGTGWQAIASSSVTWANDLTISDVPFNYTHWCVEMIIDKTSIGTAAWNGAPPIGLRVAFYDESEDLWVAWPPQSDPDIPGGWGQITGGGDSIPESLGLGVVVVTSSVAVVVSFYFLRKRPKTQSYNFGKTGK